MSPCHAVGVHGTRHRQQCMLRMRHRMFPGKVDEWSGTRFPSTTASASCPMPAKSVCARIDRGAYTSQTAADR